MCLLNNQLGKLVRLYFLVFRCNSLGHFKHRYICICFYWYDHMANNSLAVRNIYCCKYVWWFTGYRLLFYRWISIVNVLFIFPILFTFCYVYDKYDHMVNNSLAVRNIYCCKYVWWFTGYYFTDESVLSMCCLYSQFCLLSIFKVLNIISSDIHFLWRWFKLCLSYLKIQ
jgi:hypothetical protein